MDEEPIELLTEKTRLTHRQYAAIILLCVLLAFGVGLLAWNVTQFRQSGLLAARHRPRELVSFFTAGLPPQPSLQISEIQPWMTFGYINKAFLLPPSYLQSTLSIKDKRYPNMSITRFANDIYLSPVGAVAEVQAAIRNYQTSSTSP